ncbi:G1/S-specific cyclin-D3 isoform X2 [Rana temporaria]|uniref:G1/S-specific cyclin-D3 isoform X2 n=1 Tax=Rana temporaria TaxID=8407 RepID=UPI001AAC480F|nr:G1/S-specific cyclin-D3 isoform X2 [Rana temporaria]
MANEGVRVVRALLDPQLFRNPRVLCNLLAQERRQRAESAGDRCHQPEVTEDMQEILAHWILEVCEDQQCEYVVFPLAMSYIRKCLSLFPVEKRNLQLLGTVCVLLASKMKDMVPIKVDTLELYTACSVAATEIREWEVNILYFLHWDLEIIISLDFLDHILERLLLSTTSRVSLTRHSRIFLTFCALVIAAACVATALLRLGLHLNSAEDLIIYLAELIQADTSELQNCQRRIEPALTKAVETSYKYRIHLTETMQELPHISVVHN